MNWGITNLEMFSYFNELELFETRTTNIRWYIMWGKKKNE